MGSIDYDGQNEGLGREEQVWNHRCEVSMPCLHLSNKIGCAKGNVGANQISWAGCMGLSFGLVARTPQTFSQKLVQARLWAQG